MLFIFLLKIFTPCGEEEVGLLLFHLSFSFFLFACSELLLLTLRKREREREEQIRSEKEKKKDGGKESEKTCWTTDNYYFFSCTFYFALSLPYGYEIFTYRIGKCFYKRGLRISCIR